MVFLFFPNLYHAEISFHKLRKDKEVPIIFESYCKKSSLITEKYGMGTERRKCYTRLQKTAVENVTNGGRCLFNI